MPVVVATCLAWALARDFDPSVALIALGTAVLMQVVTNLQNDVGYTERGGETGTRVGLPRATARGWLRTRDVKLAIVAAIAIALVTALPLILRFGWPVLMLGLAATVAAWAYMGGRRPIAYTPFGELTVFVFFGLVAVCGTYYVQTGTVDRAAAIAGAARLDGRHRLARAAVARAAHGLAAVAGTCRCARRSGPEPVAVSHGAARGCVRRSAVCRRARLRS